MDFAKWILEESAFQGAVYWDPLRRIWDKLALGDRAPLTAYIDSKRVSIDQGPYHPEMKKALKFLIRQFPGTANLKLDFDGFSPGTVRDYLYSSEFHQRKDQLPPYLYTGTSLHRWERIREEGLLPRSMTGASAVYGANISSAPKANPDHIYLSGSFGATVRFAGREARSPDVGDTGVILRIDTRGLNPNKLRADVDWRADGWQGSFHGMNTVAYEGIIRPEFISLYKAYNPTTQKWEDPGSWLEPGDWLAQQVLHPKDYKDIPDSTASYKWTNPRSR